MSKQVHTTFANLYESGPLYNLLADEQGSFYRDVHGLTALIPELPLDQGILEIGCGWDDRAARLIQHAVGPAIEYVRDADNFVDLTAADTLPAAHGRKYSCVTAQCYILNALVQHVWYAPADLTHLEACLRNVRQVLTDDGAAVFGIYEPTLSSDSVPEQFSVDRVPNRFELGRLDPNLPAGSRLTYDVDQQIEGHLLVCEYSNIKVGNRTFGLDTPTWSNLWTDVDIHNAALAAGFSDIQFYSVEVGQHLGFSEFTLVNCTKDPRNASHVLLLA